MAVGRLTVEVFSVELDTRYLHDLFCLAVPFVRISYMHMALEEIHVFKWLVTERYGTFGRSIRIVFS